MNDLELLVDLHKRRQRQGPGGVPETRLAISLAKLSKTKPLKIADIGCGTGASTLELARTLNAEITAIDFLPAFLEALKDRAKTEGLLDKITPLSGTMEALPFHDNELDVIWSEGAIYNMGFEKGVSEWCRFLKPGGVLVVSEITWITNTRPEMIQRHWDAEYPEIATASSKIEVLERSGYTPLGYFVLPEHCWMDNYYAPLQEGFSDFLKRHDNDVIAQTVIEAEREEILLYDRYKSYYSYGVYIARKSGSIRAEHEGQ